MLLEIYYKFTMCITLITLIAIITFLLYKYFTRNFNYWKEKGIPYVTAVPLFGSFFEVFTFRSHVGIFLARLYHQYKYPYFGTFLFNNPCLIIRDPDLLKLILIKDFQYFNDHVGGCNEKCDPISSQLLFFIKNPEWKIIRDKIAPTFGISKIKKMMVLINEAAEDLLAYLERNVGDSSIEAKEVCSKYTTDVIASCAFGIQANCFQNENAEFRLVGRKVFDIGGTASLRQQLHFLFPSFVNFIELQFLDADVSTFLKDTFWDILKARKKNNYKRNDFIDTLIQMKQTCNEEYITFEDNKVLAQACQFLFAGFETVASAMSFALYELCLHPNIQKRLRTEIETVSNKYGELDHKAVQDMKYLHMVIYEFALQESLRKYPSIPFLDRMCVEDYKIPNSNYVIEKGTPVFIPVLGLHYDPKYFFRPESFNPERFSRGDSDNSNNFIHMPFGKGPRSCVGEKFGSTVIKLGLAHILSKFEVERNANTPIPLKYKTKGFMLASTVGLPMKFKKIQNNSNRRR